VTTLRTRNELRRRLYVVAILPSLLLLLLSTRIVVLLVQESRGLESYAAGRYAESRDQFAANRILNPVERWVAPFNEGDARYRQEDFAGAVEAFALSLQLAPLERECDVRINLALSHEAIGDRALQSGTRLEAEDAWGEGRAVLAGCLELVDDDPAAIQERRDGVVARKVDARLLRKLGGDDAKVEANDEVPPPDEATEEKVRTIEQRSRQAFERRQRHQQRRDDAERPGSVLEGGVLPQPQW
jgi:tetratricopeptide (TPR) repeat protein